MFSDDAVIARNTFTASAVGANIMNSRRIRVEHNRIAGNRGVPGVGLTLKDCDDSMVRGNRIADNARGLLLDGSSANRFVENAFLDNDTAATLFSSAERNQFGGNEFVGNWSDVVLSGRDSGTLWSVDGRGNYWSRYRGFDFDGDGIGDAPHAVVGAFERIEGLNASARLFLHSPAAAGLELAEHMRGMVASDALDHHPLARRPPAPSVAKPTGRRRLGLWMLAAAGVAIGGRKETTMLKVSGLTKTFGGRRVLDRLDFEMSAGERVALLGANGSGKTTTLRCIVGLARPDAGTILVGAHDLAGDAIGARGAISYLPQTSVFPPTLTVRETLAVVARLRRLDLRRSTASSRRAVWIASPAKGVGHLSGGERQRLAMAVAFLPAVDLYLFDEPTANLDPVASRILFQRAKQLARDGRTLLFTTHVPADVRHLATRIVLLRDGRIESDAAGTFELRRYESMLERDMWGNDDDDPMCGLFADDRGGHHARLRGADAVARAAAGGSR